MFRVSGPLALTKRNVLRDVRQSTGEAEAVMEERGEDHPDSLYHGFIHGAVCRRFRNARKHGCSCSKRPGPSA